MTLASPANGVSKAAPADERPECVFVCVYAVYVCVRDADSVSITLVGLVFIILARNGFIFVGTAVCNRSNVVFQLTNNS